MNKTAQTSLAPDAARSRILRRNVDGVLLLDKPVGLSSTQAMVATKRLYRAEKAGHTGTLDPFATGLLPICFGEATKFSRFLLDAEKSYCATMKLGEISRTGDTEGEIIQRRDVSVTESQVALVLQSFLGAQLQTPPMYSALKQAGVPLYKLARQGLEVPRTPRQITILAISLVSLVGDELTIETRVSKGTYIRVLAEDIGAVLGCGAHLTALRRTATGGLDLSNAITLDTLVSVTEQARDQTLLPAQSLCNDLRQIVLSDEDTRIFCNGGWVDADAENTGEVMQYAIYAESTRFLGVGEVLMTDMTRGKPRLVPLRLMSTATVAPA